MKVIQYILMLVLSAICAIGMFMIGTSLNLGFENALGVIGFFIPTVCMVTMIFSHSDR